MRSSVFSEGKSDIFKVREVKILTSSVSLAFKNSIGNKKMGSERHAEKNALNLSSDTFSKKALNFQLGLVFVSSNFCFCCEHAVYMMIVDVILLYCKMLFCTAFLTGVFQIIY